MKNTCAQKYIQIYKVNFKNLDGAVISNVFVFVSPDIALTIVINFHSSAITFIRIFNISNSKFLRCCEVFRLTLSAFITAVSSSPGSNLVVPLFRKASTCC